MKPRNTSHLISFCSFMTPCFTPTKTLTVLSLSFPRSPYHHEKGLSSSPSTKFVLLLRSFQYKTVQFKVSDKPFGKDFSNLFIYLKKIYLGNSLGYVLGYVVEKDPSTYHHRQFWSRPWSDDCIFANQERQWSIHWKSWT